MTARQPDISIVIPTRDRPQFLARSLLSALGQVGVETEIIVIDDGSQTPVADLLTPSAAAQVMVIRNPRSEDVAAARNRGIEAARAPWIAFLNDDDVWAPDKLSVQLASVREAGAVYAFANGVNIDERGRVLSVDRVPPAGTDLYRSLLAGNRIPCGCSNVIAMTSVVRDVGGFDPGILILEDWDLAIRLSRAGAGAVSSDLLVAYTVHSGNRHRDSNVAEADLGRLEDKYGAERRALEAPLDREWWLSWQASVSRVEGDARRAARSYWELGQLRKDPALISRAIALRVGAQPLLSVGRWLRRKVAPSPIEPAWLHRAADPPRALLEDLVLLSRAP